MTTSESLIGTAARTAAPPRPEDAEAGLLARVATVVTAQPDEVALIDDQGEWTFAAVAGLAAQVAVQIAALDLRRWAPGTDDEQVDPVAVLAAHRATTVAGILAVIAAGSPVVVLDSALPDARLLKYLERAGARAILTDAEHADRSMTLRKTVVVIPDTPTDPALGARARAGLITPAGRPAPDPLAPAALVFTSGTTGQPKGVVYDQRLFSRSAYNMSVRDDTYSRDDVLASVLPLGFSAGLDHTLAGFQVGARQIMRDGRGTSAAEFAAWVEDVGVTVMNISPSLARAIVAGNAAGHVLSKLRALTLTSEAVHGSDIEALRRILPPDCLISNRWGASETSLATVMPLAPDAPIPSGQLPVGWPVTGVELGVEPPEDDVTVVDGTGTMTVTSAYIARRYWRDPEKTAATFTELPDGRRRFRSADVGRFDETGCFLLLGRRDHSTKIRGYLVEPGEVEAALFGLPDVREAVVVGVEGEARTRLVAYVVCSSERPAASTIRASLRELLPTWMVPETVVFLAALPRTERGKVDRNALPTPPTLVPGGVEPRTEWEDVVAQLWARVLGLPEVGVDDDFFELGGDSLAAQALVSAVIAELNIPASALDPTALLGASTVAEFAARLRRKPDKIHSTLVPIRTEGTKLPLFCIAGGGGLALGFLPLSRHIDLDIPIWGLQAKGVEHGGIPDWTVEAAARRHVASIRSVQSQGPYHLMGHSFGGLLAYEMARQLRKAGEDVAQLVIVDALPPGSNRPPGGERPEQLLERLKDLIGLLGTGVIPNPGMGHYWRFHRQAATLIRRYRPQPYEGSALVLVVDGVERQLRSAWERWVRGGLEVRVIPGDHHSLGRDPHAGDLAAAMRRESR